MAYDGLGNERGIPTFANVPAEQRIFSAPAADPKEKKLCEEWKSYVEPELRRLFQSSIETVTSDLVQLNGNEKSLRNCTLRIPLDHADAWLNALNQARLVIAAKYDFSESELNDHYHSPVGSRRDLTR